MKQEKEGGGERIANALVILATETSRHLETVWDEVGYSTDEKHRQLEGLMAGFQRLCADKIREEESVRDQFVASLAHTREEVAALARLLGQEPPKEEEEEEAATAAATPNLTERLAHLECQVEELRAQKQEVEAAFSAIATRLLEQSRLLGEALEPRWTDLTQDLTVARLEALKLKDLELEGATRDRCQTVAELVLACQALMAQLKITDEERATPLGRQILGSLVAREDDDAAPPRLASTQRSADTLGITLDALSEVSERHAQLTAEVDRRKELLQEMGEEILSLWQQLEVPQEEQAAFTRSVEGMGMETIRAGEAELKRLRDAKEAAMSRLVVRERERLAALWLELGVTDEQGRAGFTPFTIDAGTCSDTELQAHVEEVKRLTLLLESMRPLLERIREREELCLERIEELTVEKDPNRLKTRDPTLQKQLAAELEMEKRVKKRLPKLTEHLKKALAQWEDAHGGAFEWHGERYLDRIERSEEEYNAVKDSVKLAKDAKKKLEKQQSLHAVAPTTPKRSGHTSLNSSGSLTLPGKLSKQASGRKGSTGSTGSAASTHSAAAARRAMQRTGSVSSSTGDAAAAAPSAAGSFNLLPRVGSGLARNGSGSGGVGGSLRKIYSGSSGGGAHDSNDSDFVFEEGGGGAGAAENSGGGGAGTTELGGGGGGGGGSGGGSGAAATLAGARDGSSGTLGVVVDSDAAAPCSTTTLDDVSNKPSTPPKYKGGQRAVGEGGENSPLRTPRQSFEVGGRS